MLIFFLINHNYTPKWIVWKKDLCVYMNNNITNKISIFVDFNRSNGHNFLHQILLLMQEKQLVHQLY